MPRTNAASATTNPAELDRSREPARPPPTTRQIDHVNARAHAPTGPGESVGQSSTGFLRLPRTSFHVCSEVQSVSVSTPRNHFLINYGVVNASQTSSTGASISVELVTSCPIVFICTSNYPGGSRAREPS